MQSAHNHNSIQNSSHPKTSPANANEKFQQAIAKKDYPSAAAILRGQGFSPAIRNNLGVCLLRTGQTDEALQVFRSFILDSSGVYERTDASDISRRNFATTLILKQLPSGAFSVLEKTSDQKHSRQLELLQAISSWAATLGWFQWLNWKVNRVAPSRCLIKLDFELGEFESTETSSPQQSPVPPPKRAA